MFEKFFGKKENKWEVDHYLPSEVILDQAQELEDEGKPTDHAILLSILTFLDEEVGSQRKRELTKE